MDVSASDSFSKIIRYMMTMPHLPPLHTRERSLTWADAISVGKTAHIGEHNMDFGQKHDLRQVCCSTHIYI